MKSMNKDKQHREDTKYLQWSDGMYVMLDDLLCDYELALVEDSLRYSVFNCHKSDFYVTSREDCLGVIDKDAGLWWGEDLKTKITRAQALYIATGDVNI
jgi:hypothetical protein